MKQKHSGFTLIELSISIAYIAVLSITIAVLTVNLINSYRRGITLKEVNTVSGELLDDIRTAISNSSAKGLSEICSTVYTEGSGRTACETDHAYAFTYFVNYATVTLSSNGKTTTLSNTPVYGGFCSGTYSYIWNSGYFFNNGEYAVKNTNPLSLSYTTAEGDKNASNFRLLKVLDPSRSVCIAATTGKTSLADNSSSTLSYPSSLTSKSSNIDIRSYTTITETPVDLLPEGNNQDLALYHLDIDKPSEDSESRNVLYTGSFILATVSGGINIKATGNYCATPDDYVSELSDLNYCAINKYNFAARATGE